MSSPTTKTVFSDKNGGGGVGLATITTSKYYINMVSHPPNEQPKYPKRSGAISQATLLHKRTYVTTQKMREGEWLRRVENI